MLIIQSIPNWSKPLIGLAVQFLLAYIFIRYAETCPPNLPRSHHLQYHLPITTPITSRSAQAAKAA